MRRVTWPLCLGAVLAVVVVAAVAPVRTARAASWPACAQSGTCHFTVLKDQHKLAVDGPADDRTVDIEYDIYIPDVAVSDPQPGIIHFNGLGGGKGDGAAILTSGLMASHGYVVLAFTSQGNSDDASPGSTKGHSGGVLELDAPAYDIKVAKQMLDLLVARPEVLKINGDPQVGTTGGSYGGAPQELLAEFDSRIKVITPWRTFNNPEYTLSPNNLGLGYDLASDGPARPVGVLKHGPGVAFMGLPVEGWLDLIFVQGSVQNGIHGNHPGNPADHCPGWDPLVCSLYQGSVADGRATQSAIDLVNKSAPANYLDPSPINPLYPGKPRPGLRVPTMLVQGEHDFLFNENEAIATYLALKARGVPVEMIWQYGAHGYDGPLTGGGTNEGDLQGDLGAQGADPSNPLAYGGKYLPRRIVAWIDHHLRHTNVPTGPEFSYYRDWIQYDHHGYAGLAFGDAAAYPAQPMMALPLSGSADLLAPGRSPQAGIAQVINPPGGIPASFTEMPNFQAPDSLNGGPSPWTGLPPSDPPGQAAPFTSDAFIRDLVSVGGPTAHIHLRHSTSAPDITLFAKLFDVAPDGTATLVPRAPAPVRIPAPAATDLTADIKLLPFAHLFPSGHRVRLTLASTDAAMAGNLAPDVITLVQGGPDPATLSLPVDAGAVPLAPSATLPGGPGSLPATATSPSEATGGLVAIALMVVAPLALALGYAARRARERLLR
ncbi:MAG: hypothetical protein M3O87_00405 [Candidatus Dormibacteraeota bacterium]|nr:hypothetical protein [Candidatus Dormibacteraeota bacterium]